ncbi:TAXI family TRAP transporter solute-binding subunit [Defluviicoccus vanus]|uniref:TAXI family TRAP transporter solute-binding subunit n=1 Tax=Defluviicoccus vanus TaxID=111831 RepID=A0A7H1MXM6_9PROT|nr:TAXI family TRAP transporter solute-binding subunit [Defluviicoccus vanus]QNT68212.1 TAXI family TRAP transporter solute-binding subunit [Defluviicoccus vanus]
MRMIRVIAALLLALGLLGGRAGAAQAQQSVDALRNKANQGTVSIISGGVNGTYIRIASDLAAVLDKDGELRILPIVGKGSVRNLLDLLYLRGIDVAILQSDVLSYSLKEHLAPNLAQRIRYITKLYNEEVHILAGRDVAQVADLAGRKVNVDGAGSGTAMTASILFDALGVKIVPTNFDQALALEKLKAGEIAAMVYVVGKPAELFSKIAADSGLHLLSLPLTPNLLQTYLPSSLSHSDYPALIAEGQAADTVAVGAVMAVYNWDPKSERYKTMAAFVDAFFDDFDRFLQPPRHPKWQDVNLAAELPGWTRFQPAQDWLDRRPTTAGTGYDIPLKNSFDEFIAFMQQSGGNPREGATQSREALFARFLEWRKRQQEASPTEAITILTGDPSGVYYPLGTALGTLYGKLRPAAQVTVQATQGSVQNLNLLQAGRGDIAFALADSVDLAWKGDAELGFPSRLDKLRTVAAIYPNYIQVVATKASGIQSLADLKGKRVSVGAPRSGTEINARRVFAAAGLSYDMMSVQYLPFGESVALMKQGDLDATLQSAGLGVASIRELASAVPITLVPIPPKVVARIGGPAYVARTIPAGTYAGQTQDVPTASINNLLMTREGVPAEVIYTITKAMFDNLPALTTAHAAAQGIALNHAVQGSPVPLHPGAQRYFREKGLLR